MRYNMIVNSHDLREHSVINSMLCSIDKLHFWGVKMPDRFRSADIKYKMAELISGAV